VIASGGAANIIDHPAGRVYREALQFSVSGQTSAVMENSPAIPNSECSKEYRIQNAFAL
jgi:hypothetical protein